VHIALSLERAATYIRQTNLKNGDPNTLLQLSSFGNAAWKLILAIYESKWDLLHTQDNISFHDRVSAQFKGKQSNTPQSKLTNQQPPVAPPMAKVSRIPPPLPPRLPINIRKKVLEKITKDNAARKEKSLKAPSNKPHAPTQSYARAALGNPSDILKLRETFPSLPNNKILEMHKASLPKEKAPAKRKPQITTKGPSHKNVIIPLDPIYKNTVYKKANKHVYAINNSLTSIKSKVRVDCICLTLNGISITTNEVASSSDLSSIEGYFKGLKDLNNTDVTPRLPQSKSYLKILGIPYFNPVLAGINVPVNPVNNSQIEEVLSKTSMFQDITLASRPCVIRASKNSNMVVIWIDIWDSQNGTKAKSLINRSFNFGQHIATIRGTNMNPGVPQCRKCWKWGHTTFACRSHGARCPKCNGPYTFEHHRDLVWCCKGNNKTEPPTSATKQGEPCPHTFKCTNCKGDHQADDPKCPFWKHRFNREWHTKKSQELREIRANSICLAVGGKQI